MQGSNDARSDGELVTLLGAKQPGAAHDKNYIESIVFNRFIRIDL